MSKQDTKKVSKYGDGSIRIRSNGMLEKRIYDSRRGKQVSVYAKTKTELNRKVKKKQDEMERGDKGVSSKLNVEEYSLKWLRIYKCKAIRDSTFDKHEQMILTHIAPSIGYLKIRSVCSDDIQKMFNDLAERKAYSTIQKVYEVIYQVFKHAVLVGDIEKNPLDAVTLPKEENVKVKTKSIEIYSDEELHRLYETMIEAYETKGKYRLAPMYIFLASTGLRRGELLASYDTDVDYENRNIKINKTLTRVKNRDPETLEALSGYHTIVTKPKTKSSIRDVPLNDMAIWCLREMQRRNELENISSKYICCNSNGEMLCSRSFDQMLERLCKAADVKFRGLHAFRHTFATRCFAKGIDVKVVSKILGHSNVNITYSTYIHVLKEQELEAVDLLNKI